MSTDHYARRTIGPSSDGSSLGARERPQRWLEALDLRFSLASIGAATLFCLRRRHAEPRICFTHCMRFVGTRLIALQMNRSETRVSLTAKKMPPRPATEPQSYPIRLPVFLFNKIGRRHYSSISGEDCFIQNNVAPVSPFLLDR